MFVDLVELLIQAGKGGNGVVAWRREKYIPKGGPTGGNGGKGGSVFLEADVNVPALDWFRNRKRVAAEDGRAGGDNCRQGRRGGDLVLKVPCGTLVKNAATGEIIKDLTQDKERFLLCSGGRGGRGNDSFKSSTRQAPNFATLGKPGESVNVVLELKLIADVGLVGFPNAGKSTLIGALANLHVKVAPYPFTTLRPNIGFIRTDDQRKIFVADIPGIIKNAHQNRGLGLEFLRHIERTRLLVFVLDASGIDGRTPLEDYRILREELAQYDAALLERPSFIILNKIDEPDSEIHLKAFYEGVQTDPARTFEVSALLSEGLDPLIKAIVEVTCALG